MCSESIWTKQSRAAISAATQAYLTEALGAAIVTLGRRQQLEAAPGLLPAVLQAVGSRLSSPDRVVRCPTVVL